MRTASRQPAVALAAYWHGDGSALPHLHDVQISFEPGFGCIPEFGAGFKSALSRIFSFFLQLSERAKGAEKASCGKTVVQKGVFGESVSSLPSKGFQVFEEQTLRGQRRNGLSTNTLLDNRFSARRLLRSFGAPPSSEGSRANSKPAPNPGTHQTPVETLSETLPRNHAVDQDIVQP